MSDFDRRSEARLPSRRSVPRASGGTSRSAGRILAACGDALVALVYAWRLRLLSQPLVLRAAGNIAAGTRGPSLEPGNHSAGHASHGVRLASAATGRRPQ